MKRSTNSVIGVLILASFIVLSSCKGNAQEGEDTPQNDAVEKTEMKDNPYEGLRGQAINVTPDQLQLVLENDNDVYGIVMDWNMGDAIVTVVSFQTGDASVYLSTGQAFIGGYGHETVTNAAKNFVAKGQDYLSKATQTENTEPTTGNKIGFYFLTKSGKYYVEDDFAKIEDESSDVLELFGAANEVITEYRMITDH